jgi:O-antigen/teichoic acid export membrane protein
MERRAIVGRECRQLALLFAPVVAALVLLGPSAASVLTDGRYALHPMLILAACLAGLAKVVMAFPPAMLKVCGRPRDLLLLNGWGALWLMLTICGALAGARQGLAGLLLGASLAGSVAIFLSFRLAWSRLDRVDP